MRSGEFPVIRELAFDQVSYRFSGAAEPIFENISFTMPKAKAVWVRSPGGRGKSTLLRLLAGLFSPTSGRYLINGESVTDMSFEEFLPYRLSMGYSFDFGGLLSNKTLAENLMLPLQYHNLLSPDEAGERVQQMIETFALHQGRDMRPSAVPGSARKLTCVLRSLVTCPQVVFMDDPLTGLKQDNINDLVHYVEESFSLRGLRQIYFTSESGVLAQHFPSEELMISADWFTSREVQVA
ncbi:MAG: ATP-binding cassette domain-containing protein [Bdellovibrionales bacterium]